MRRIAILGSTGSIGRQTLDVISQFPDDLQVVALAAGSNADLLQAQAHKFGVKNIALFSPHEEIPSGISALEDMASSEGLDWVVVSVAGVIGLQPTLAAIKAQKNIALASKEVLVAAGELVMPLVKEAGIHFTPIDSEHSAVFQCMQGYESSQVEELILTASGGPFRGRTKADLEKVTVKDALNHPTWNMGGKITIDSASLFNKGLETIEAKWLFGLEIDQVQTVLHPQSVLHSLVKFKDGSCLGQLGWPDMRLPIAYSLLYPDRLPNKMKPWNPVDTPSLTFEKVDHETFPGIEIAKESVRKGGTTPCAMNAANEQAVAEFLSGNLSFLNIYDIVKEITCDHVPSEVTMESLLFSDAEARRIVKQRVHK